MTYPVAVALVVVTFILRFAAGEFLSDFPFLSFFPAILRNAIVHNGVLDHGVSLLAKPFSLEQLAHKIRELLGTA